MPKTINRWWDKTLQLVFCSNGRAGVVVEHSLNDGTMIGRVLSDAMDKL